MAEELAAHRSPSVLVEGDAFFAFLREGRIEPWLPESHTQNEMVTLAAAAATGRFAEEVWTVYDGIMGAWFLPTFMAATGLATAHYVVLLPSVERCVERVATRVGHGFTDDGGDPPHARPVRPGDGRPRATCSSIHPTTSPRSRRPCWRGSRPGRCCWHPPIRRGSRW